MRKRVLPFVFILVLCAFTPLRNATAQTSGHPRDPQFEQQRNSSDSLEKMQKESAKRRNKDRQQHIKTDTDKLLTLATELKEYVDKSNENILSLNVIRKAEEIEKLAHQVREKMKAEQ